MIVYKPGRSTTVADALSRREGGSTDMITLCTAVSSISIDWDLLMKEVKVIFTLFKIY